jgi:hypothetical protein
MELSNSYPCINHGKYFRRRGNNDDHSFYPDPNLSLRRELRISNLRNYSSTTNLLDHRYNFKQNQCSCDSY